MMDLIVDLEDSIGRGISDRGIPVATLLGVEGAIPAGTVRLVGNQ